MRILLPGGGGFIGSHTVDRLLQEAAHEVWGYDLYDEKLRDSRGHARLTYIQGDIRTDHARLERLGQDADVVVDLIAYANPALYVSMPLAVYRLPFTREALFPRRLRALNLFAASTDRSCLA